MKIHFVLNAIENNNYFKENNLNYYFIYAIIPHRRNLYEKDKVNFYGSLRLEHFGGFGVFRLLGT